MTPPARRHYSCLFPRPCVLPHRSFACSRFPPGPWRRVPAGARARTCWRIRRSCRRTPSAAALAGGGAPRAAQHPEGGGPVSVQPLRHGQAPEHLGRAERDRPGLRRQGVRSREGHGHRRAAGPDLQARPQGGRGSRCCHMVRPRGRRRAPPGGPPVPGVPFPQAGAGPAPACAARCPALTPEQLRNLEADINRRRELRRRAMATRSRPRRPPRRPAGPPPGGARDRGRTAYPTSIPIRGPVRAPGRKPAAGRKQPARARGGFPSENRTFLPLEFRCIAGGGAL